MDLLQISQKMRLNILEMAYKSKTGHIGSALSISDILTVLYFKILDIRPKEPFWPERDRFILSKGHAAAALYSILALRGFFSEELLKLYCVDGGLLAGHPCVGQVPGIEFSSGSLGHGLSVAAGMALALKDKYQNKIYTLLGDGECNEGSVWEAATFIATHNLSNVAAIIDNNKFQGFGLTKDIDKIQSARKWEAFGWQVFNVDGHNLLALEKVLLEAKLAKVPTVVIADTIAGKGVPAIENTLLAHYYILDEASYQEALKKLDYEK